MPGVSRVGVDTAGAVIFGILAPTVTINGSPVVVLGAQVTPHAPGPPHAPAPPVMVQASGSVTAGGIPVCRQGDAASCGHPATGSGDVFAGG